MFYSLSIYCSINDIDSFDDVFMNYSAYNVFLENHGQLSRIILYHTQLNPH
jgi:hypothetical protein